VKKKKSKFLASHLVYSILGFVCVCVLARAQALLPLASFHGIRAWFRQEGALGSKQEAEIHHLFPLVDYYTLGGSTSGGVGKKSPIEELTSQACADRDSA
jgi:hypothetical protein